VAVLGTIFKYAAARFLQLSGTDIGQYRKLATPGLGVMAAQG